MRKRKSLVITVIIVLLGIVAYIFMQSALNVFMSKSPSATSPKTQTPDLAYLLTATPLQTDTTAVEQNDDGAELHVENHIETIPPIVLSSLENDTTIRFFCLNSEECYQNIDLSPHIAKYVDLSEWKNVNVYEAEKSLGGRSAFFNIHYISPTSVYVVLFNAIEQPIILRFNPQTHQVASTILPASSPWWGENYFVVNENLVVLSRIGERTPTSDTRKDVLFVIRPDLSVAQTELDTGCVPDTAMFAGIDGNVILLKVQTLPQEAKHFAEVCIVDTISGEQTQKQK